jgi:hypothetical protein
MAKRQSAKTNKGERSNRGNGKAPKKNPKTNPGLKRDWITERRMVREGLPAIAKRNEFGHVIKRIDDHEVLICDHPKGHIHEKV